MIKIKRHLTYLDLRIRKTYEHKLKIKRFIKKKKATQIEWL